MKKYRLNIIFTKPIKESLDNYVDLSDSKCYKINDIRVGYNAIYINVIVHDYFEVQLLVYNIQHNSRNFNRIRCVIGSEVDEFE